MSDALENACAHLSDWAGSGQGWQSPSKVFKRDSPDAIEHSTEGLAVAWRGGVEQQASRGITRLRKWTRSKALVAIVRTGSNRDVAAALAMAKLTGPEYPLLMLVCAEQWQHLPTVQRYAHARGLEPVAAMDALERILWRRAAISIDQRAKTLGMRAANYRQSTRDAEAVFRCWLDSAATAFLNALNNHQ
jgi:hypothetical protein